MLTIFGRFCSLSCHTDEPWYVIVLSVTHADLSLEICNCQHPHMAVQGFAETDVVKHGTIDSVPDGLIHRMRFQAMDAIYLQILFGCESIPLLKTPTSLPRPKPVDV